MKRKVSIHMTVEVEVDETKFTPEFMRQFQESMYDFDIIEEHIEHLGQLCARGILHNFSTFIEGYGPPAEMGIKARIVDQDEEISSVSEAA
jgi:hypothetical protein